MQALTVFAWVFYGVLVLVALAFPAAVQFNDVPVRNPLTRVAVVVVILPIIGCLFSLFGLVGNFLLLPIRSLF